MENELLREKGKKQGVFLGREVVEMSQTISPKINKPYGLKRVCEVWGISRSTLYRRQNRESNDFCAKRGPKPTLEDDVLLLKIHDAIKNSPFKGEGHRKIHARLKRKGVRTGRN